MTRPDTDFAAALARELARTGMTQRELARLAGLTPAAVQYLLNGLRRPGLATAARIADALGVTLDALRR